MHFLTDLQEAIAYMEEHLLEPINYQDVASYLHQSNYHFHRTFSMITGMTANEYIRKRRLSDAGQELMTFEYKVIDVALKYGYDSPESFSKAFSRFHGVTPYKVKQLGQNLKSFNRLVIKIQVEGGTEMEYKIVRRDSFQLITKVETFAIEHAANPESTAIADFWSESNQNGVSAFLAHYGADFYGVCASITKESKQFEYGIGTEYKTGDVPEGYKLWTIAAPLWAVFPCIGSDPKCIGETWDRIFKEFLPNSAYEMVDATDFELYPAESQIDLFCEIWIPVQKKDRS
ncbi:AraC family transcriptional regulator [Amphibacillus marinus]|uniref:AraC family transcriptional regulator n=1 Tax=Amphibacillus marinus TaxID=872970 RepID=A0A1H8TZV4_9BACI|nr:AraC family transcriptional regulator [Amphibacillus marinus]SEO96093.1 AraC family transcriptional regulator [Amphibacillus marinus]